MPGPPCSAIRWVLLALLGASPLSPADARSHPPTFPNPAPTKPTPAIEAPLILDWSKVHDAGNVRLLVTNWGLVGSRPGSSAPYSGAPSAQWPAGSATEYLWSAGLWIGALKNGEPHVTTGQYETEFRPGRTELDRVYATHEGAPGGNRRPSSGADDDLDGKIDEDRLDGRDNDLDGKIDEDFAAISNQMFYCEYGDTDPNIKLSLPEHVPLEVRVRQASLAWSEPLLHDFIGFDFKIINAGLDPLEQVYVGLFADCDIGPRSDPNASTDDMAGFYEGVVHDVPAGQSHRSVKLSLGYMWDDDGDAGLSEGYIGFLLLGAQEPWNGWRRALGLRNFRFSSGGVSFDQGGDAYNDPERYQILDGTAPHSLPPPDSLTGLHQPSASAKAADYRMVLSAGPCARIEPGDTLGFQVALVMGHHFDGMLANAAQAQALYDGVWFDFDGDPTTGVDRRETPVCAPLNAGQWFRIDPCDAACDSTPYDPECAVQVPVSGCAWVNGDCELERLTGESTGIDGKESAVHWLAGPIIAVEVADLEARTAAGGVELAWRLSAPALQELLGVGVQRAPAAARPFEVRTPSLLTPTISMAFADPGVEPGRVYWYRLALRYRNGTERHTQPVVVVFEGSPPQRTTLSPPFQADGGAVQIHYSIAGAPAPVRLAVYDVSGRLMRVLEQGRRDRGSYYRFWDRRDENGAGVVRGVYLVSLRTGATSVTRKLVLWRE